jgi:hypothetical protein
MAFESSQSDSPREKLEGGWSELPLPVGSGWHGIVTWVAAFVGVLAESSHSAAVKSFGRR